MRENLSAPGTVVEWLQITKQALKNLDYHNITQDPRYARLSARYGYDDYIIVNIRSKSEDRVLLEFEVSSPKMVQQFKTASAQIVRQMQNEYKQKQEEAKYGPIQSPKPYVPQPSEPKTVFPSEDTAVPAYEAEEGDYIERTRFLPDETLTLKKYHEGIDRYETEKFKHKFEFWFNRFWVIWLMLFLLPPFGIFLIWYFHRMRIVTRVIVSVLFFLYFVLIWIGFFGIDTGFDREALQRFYLDQQYRITRIFNGQSPTTPSLPDSTTGTDYYEEYDTYNPDYNAPVFSNDVIQEEKKENIFDLINEFFQQFRSTGTENAQDTGQ